MNSRKIIIVFLLLSNMKTIIGQAQPVNCKCHIAFISNGTVHFTDCNTRGCSIGTNSFCDRYSFYFLTFRCCDGGAYGPAIGKPEYNYNYTTCTDYGYNARDRTGDVPYGENIATDCCNYCCDRNDPYLITTVLTSTTTTTTTTITTTTTTTYFLLKKTLSAREISIKSVHRILNQRKKIQKSTTDDTEKLIRDIMERETEKKKKPFM